MEPSNRANQIIQKICQKQALIGVIGMGYVGLPLVLRFCEEDFRVLGFDVDPKKVVTLQRGKSYLKSIPTSRISQFVRSGHL